MGLIQIADALAGAIGFLLGLTLFPAVFVLAFLSGLREKFLTCESDGPQYPARRWHDTEGNT